MQAAPMRGHDFRRQLPSRPIPQKLVKWVPLSWKGVAGVRGSSEQHNTTSVTANLILSQFAVFYISIYIFFKNLPFSLFPVISLTVFTIVSPLSCIPSNLIFNYELLFIIISLVLTVFVSHLSVVYFWVLSLIYAVFQSSQKCFFFLSVHFEILG